MKYKYPLFLFKERGGGISKLSETNYECVREEIIKILNNFVRKIKKKEYTVTYYNIDLFTEKCILVFEWEHSESEGEMFELTNSTFKRITSEEIKNIEIKGEV